jgi:hypothetical protein
MQCNDFFVLWTIIEEIYNIILNLVRNRDCIEPARTKNIHSTDYFNFTHSLMELSPS